MDDEPNVGLYRPDRTFTLVVVRDEEHRGICLHQHLAFVEIHFHDDRLIVLVDAQQQFSAYAESRRAIGRAFFDAGKRQGNLANGLQIERLDESLTRLS